MILRATLAVLAALVLSACGSGAGSGARALPDADLYDRVISAKVVRVGVKSDTPPFGFQQGEAWFGFDVEVALALFQEMGIDNVVFVPVTSANRMEKLAKNEVDCVVASMTITRTREKTVDFSIPYFQDGQALMVKADSPIQSYLDLGSKKVGAVKGSTSAANMNQVAPEAQIVQFGSFQDLGKALDEGKVDAITSDSIILLGMMKRGGRSDAYRLAGDRFSTEPYGIALAHNQSRFRDLLNEGLQRIWENGRWQLIHDTWFGPRSKYAIQTGFSIAPFPR